MNNKKIIPLKPDVPPEDLLRDAAENDRRMAEEFRLRMEEKQSEMDELVSEIEDLEARVIFHEKRRAAVLAALETSLESDPPPTKARRPLPENRPAPKPTNGGKKKVIPRSSSPVLPALTPVENLCVEVFLSTEKDKLSCDESLTIAQSMGYPSGMSGWRQVLKQVVDKKVLKRVRRGFYALK